METMFRAEHVEVEPNQLLTVKLKGNGRTFVIPEEAILRAYTIRYKFIIISIVNNFYDQLYKFKKKCTHALVFSDIFFRPSSIHSVQNHIFLTQKSKLWQARIFFWPNNTLLEHFGSKHLLIIMVYIFKNPEIRFQNFFYHPSNLIFFY